ncbi:LysR family transcriptional regulator [Deinococcus aquiradiocola]|uniref:LysR family transcriptional regulator n=1 Tax=Deinococcus aquiradiocola TaxID=393059 RepID=A0A917P4C7_9DEIO|nr:LysR family transcriptional regulator [Deinococcus aquiradiocola]GGJ60845.1 LysR family transcriptional regulator [Deinococcus aquiradiocola]
MKPRSAPTLSQMRLFLAVLQAGGFGEAAAELGMSQSSVSEGVAGLERALNVRLLRRTASGVTPTPAGTRAQAHAERAVQAAQDLQLAVQDDAELHGTLTLAAPRSVATFLLPPVLAAFRARHPDVRVQVMDADSDGRDPGTLLQSGRADVVILNLPAQGPLLSWPYWQDEYVLIVPGDRGAPGETRARWADLNGTLLLPAGTDACNRRLHTYLHEHAVTPQSVLEIENDSVMLGLVAHGLGYAILPRLATLPLPAGVRVLPLPETLERHLGVAVLPARAGLPLVSALASSLRTRAAGEAALPVDAVRQGASGVTLPGGPAA